MFQTLEESWTAPQWMFFLVYDSQAPDCPETQPEKNSVSKITPEELWDSVTLNSDLHTLKEYSNT